MWKKRLCKFPLKTNMKNFLNGWRFLTSIPLLILILCLSMSIYDTSKCEHHCCEGIAIVIVALCGAAFLLVSSILYLGSYLLSGLLISDKQRQMFLFYVTSILYWIFNLSFIFVNAFLYDFLQGKCLRFIKDHFALSLFFGCLVWWILSVCLAIIVSRFASEGFLQKTNRIFSKIGRCLCWIVVLFFLCIFALHLLGHLLSRNKPETSFSRRECLEREPRSEGKFFPLKSREDLLRKAWLYPRTSRSF